MNTASQNLLKAHILSPHNACSVGGFGALAEFDEESVEVTEHTELRLVVKGKTGALALNWRAPVEALAYECISARENAWMSGVGFVLDEPENPNHSAVLTEIGRDVAALFDEHADDLLFDIGVPLPNVSFCIRTADRILIELLRRHEGRPILTPEHPVMEAIIDHGPHRIAFNEFARIEVYQPIDRHVTPVGSHTHVLPGLLKARRSHSANIHYPRGKVPALTLHPENPLTDKFGHQSKFRPAVFEKFQGCLAEFGDAHYVSAKKRIQQAFESDQIAAYQKGRDRVERTAEKIALRQFFHLGADSEKLERWQALVGH